MSRWSPAVLAPGGATLSNPAARPKLALDLNRAAKGDGSALATQARATLAGARSAAGDGPVAKSCVDSPTRWSVQGRPNVIRQLTRVSRVGGLFIGWDNWAPCASWPARAADRYRGPWNPTTANPVLVIGTRYDPSTPYANARRVARRLPNAVMLTHDGYGHTSESDQSACVQAATSAYLVKLVTPPPGTVCRSNWLPFDPRFGREPPAFTGALTPPRAQRPPTR